MSRLGMVRVKLKLKEMNTEHELFGELHEQEENELFGNEHKRQHEAQNFHLTTKIDMKNETIINQQKPHDAKQMLDAGWISGDENPTNTQDVIAMVVDGTFFMARYYHESKWNFYFSDTGLKSDDTRRMKVICWLPLERLPACR